MLAVNQQAEHDISPRGLQFIMPEAGVVVVCLTLSMPKSSYHNLLLLFSETPSLFGFQN